MLTYKGESIYTLNASTYYNKIIPMKKLLILRHAKSRPKDPDTSDHDRDLAEVGKDDALKMGKLLRLKDLVPDFIISSSAPRSKTTAEIVAKGCKCEGPEIAIQGSLYKAEPQDCVNIVDELYDRYIYVLLVGHNPAKEETVESLTATPDAIVLSTCALAHLSYTN
jgi:phosphohistidine phosphatase